MMNKSFVFLLVLSFSWVAAYSQDFISCVESRLSNATSISQLIFTPENASFLPIWQSRVQNARFLKDTTPKPSIIVTPTDESQVQTTFLCAKENGYRVRIRSGGHDFEGISFTDYLAFVMIDLINMRSIDVDVASKSAWVQSGAVLGELYYAISQKTNTLYFPGGTWPTVAIAGLVGGGGTGNLLRKYATAGDNVLDARIVDVNGNILDRKSMGEDLFWAIRGGVASNFGIVLSWKLNLVPVPEKVTVFIVNRTLEQGATDLFYKYQSVVPNTKDRNLYIRSQLASEFIGNTTKKTIRIIFQGIYQGSTDMLLPLLNKEFPELGVTREICREMTSIQSTLVFAGRPSTTPTEILNNRSATPRMSSKTKSSFVTTPIPKSGLRKIWRKFFENDLSGGILIIPSGGRMADYSETATPYPHRAGTLYLLASSVNFAGQTSDITPVSLRRLAWLASLEKLLTPYVSRNPRQSYVNNNDFDFGIGADNYTIASVWGERYWKRANFKKLIRIKAKVDPQNFFNHPQGIPVFSAL
ncbi:hypothetical protein LXL04_032798 [Taraxacum kok-saghyz]